MTKKILSLILALVLILPLCPAFELPLAMPASAEETEGAADAEGTTGACTWKLEGTVLTISPQKTAQTALWELSTKILHLTKLSPK